MDTLVYTYQLIDVECQASVFAQRLSYGKLGGGPPHATVPAAAVDRLHKPRLLLAEVDADHRKTWGHPRLAPPSINPVS